MVACIVVIVRVRVVLDDEDVNGLERGRPNLGKLKQPMRPPRLRPVINDIQCFQTIQTSVLI